MSDETQTAARSASLNEVKTLPPLAGIKAFPPLADLDSDLDADLVEKIIQKSEEGKISWTRNREGHSGKSMDSTLQIELHDQNVPFFGKTWRSFLVSKTGKQLLALNNEAAGLMALAGVPNSAAHRKVSLLMNYLETARIRQVRSALAELDEL